MATPDWAKFGKDFALVLTVTLSTGCGLLGSSAGTTVLEAIREPAVEVLTNVINDRMDAMVDKETAVCWELPEGFQSGEEDLDDDDRGAFVVCWSRAKE